MRPDTPLMGEINGGSAENDLWKTEIAKMAGTLEASLAELSPMDHRPNHAIAQTTRGSFQTTSG